MWTRTIILTVCAAAILWLPNTAHTAKDELLFGPNAAIVIDDFGNDMEGTQEMLNLPFQITVAVMPFMRSTKRDAELAHRKGHDVIVHLPMEPLKGKKSWLGPGGITSDLSDEEIRKRVNAAIDDVPYAIGMNNHMGSKITVNRRIMTVVLEVCRERGLFFLDSHTNYGSIVSELAKEMGVPCIENRLFLDDVKTGRHVSKQLKAMFQYLNEHAACVAIGHVGIGGKLTAEAIKEAQKQTSEIQFVGISKLLQ